MSAGYFQRGMLRSVAAGAKALVSENGFEIAKEGTNYVQPQGSLMSLSCKLALMSSAC